MDAKEFFLVLFVIQHFFINKCCEKIEEVPVKFAHDIKVGEE